MVPFSKDSVCSTKAAKYALEVNSGWFEEKNINIGESIEIKKILSNKLDLPLPFSPKIKFPFLQGKKDVPNKFLTFEILSWVICILDR